MNLIEIFGNSAQVKIIQFMLRSKEQLMNLSDIARRTKLANSTVSRVIENLISIGLVNEMKIGNLMRVISLAGDSPLTNVLLKFKNEIESI